MGRSGLPSHTCFLGFTQVHIPNGISIDSAVLYSSRSSVLYFRTSRSFPRQKVLLLMRGSGLTSNSWFLGLTRPHNANGISIGSTVFAGLTSVTDRPTNRPTDHATRSVTIGHIYVRSTAMRPNNNYTEKQSYLLLGFR